MDNQYKSSFPFETRQITEEELSFVTPLNPFFLLATFASRPDNAAIDLNDSTVFATVELLNTNPITIPVVLDAQVIAFAFEVTPDYPQFNYWQENESNNGAIGGNWNDPFRNWISDPIIKEFNGRDYRVYISNYKSGLTGNMELWVK